MAKTKSAVANGAIDNSAHVKAQARRKALWGLGFLTPFLLLFLLVFIIPVISAIYDSFFQLKVASGCGPYGCADKGQVAQFVGLTNFFIVISSKVFWLAMGRVFLYGIVQIPIMIIFALGLALLLDSFAARHQKLYRLLYFLPYAIPGVIAAIIWIFIYSPGISPFQGLYNLLGVHPNFFSGSVVMWSMANVTTWTYTGYNMLIFYSALQAVPTELYEAARMDGATEWQVTTKVKLPMLSSAVLLTVLLSIIGTIQLFNEPQMFQKVAGLPTTYMPLMMTLGINNHQVVIDGVSGSGLASAMSLVMAAIAGILALGYAWVQRKVAKND